MDETIGKLEAAVEALEGMAAAGRIRRSHIREIAAVIDECISELDNA